MSRLCAQKWTVALAGNPNVGKSTLFNALTGLHQHTGNWPGKTVSVAVGECRRKNRIYEFVDLPGTYSLEGKSEDEQIAGEYLFAGKADCTIVVCDGGCLERNLILALQVMACTERVILCVNLMDEATRMGITVHGQRLSELLGVPVLLTSAGDRSGREQLLMMIQEISSGKAPNRTPIEPTVKNAEMIASQCVEIQPRFRLHRQRKLDKILTGSHFGIPILLAVLFLIVWLTVWGANYPSSLLERFFQYGYQWLQKLLQKTPEWLSGILLEGIYATTARVMSVMLPPMMIFFPLFTLLEDVGYLPRMAFLLDHGMSRCGGCGKQALTMCMGLGCNAVGVTGCRIMEDPVARRRAILTNSMIPCNGRFPTLIILGSLFFPETGAALLIAVCIMMGVAMAMFTSGLMHGFARKRTDYTFIMEMPPFRRPRLSKILVRSLLDRTLKIAGRTLTVAIPAGMILWLLMRFNCLSHAAVFLEPVAAFMGLNGIILLGFLLSLPANELLLPVIALIMMGGTSLYNGAVVEAGLLQSYGWSWTTAVCTMAFTLFHWPCATTLLTIRQETKSWRDTLLAFLIPTSIGVVICVLLNTIFQLFGI